MHRLSRDLQKETPESIMGQKSTTQRRLDTGSKTGVLAFSGKKLKQIPKKVLSMKNIRVLDLSDNLLPLIPVEISALVMLKTLHLKNNRITGCQDGGECLSALKKLEVLTLDGNRLEQIPKLPTKLTKFSITKNQLVTIQIQGKMKNLKHFDASGNKIVQVDKSIGTLSAVQVLNLSHNQLIELPKEVGDMGKLSDLDVSYNSLEDLPAELGNCDNLQVILANSNRLSIVDRAIFESKSLSRLRLENNKITKKSFLQFDGVKEFMERRNARVDRELAGGMHETDRSICGLD